MRLVLRVRLIKWHFHGVEALSSCMREETRTLMSFRKLLSKEGKYMVTKKFYNIEEMSAILGKTIASIAKKQKTEVIPMNEQARAILNALPHTQSAYVFPGRYDDKARTNISPMLKRVREKAGLPESFRPLHGLRHSFASWLASSGQVSMYELQKLLTHSSPQMTQRYAHLHDDALKKASGVASTLFSAAQNKESGQASQEAPKAVETKTRSKKRQAKSESA